jgi:hypothetical protein
MRFTRYTAVVLLIIISTLPVAAQSITFFTIDTSMRAEFLFGHQKFLYERHNVNDLGNIQKFRYTFDPKLALLTGKVEISPSAMISGRLGGSISVFEKSHDSERTWSGPEFAVPGAGSFSTKPDFWSWDVAGLLHLWNQDNYRFGISAGFRKDKWTYISDVIGLGLGVDRPLSITDEFTSNIPYLGLQTSMRFPWWKARFEFIGSPFMSRDVRSSANGFFSEFRGRPTSGGLLEFQVEGQAGIRPNLYVGINFTYSSLELYGTSVGRTTGVTGDYGIYTNDSLFKIGFDVDYAF